MTVRRTSRTPSRAMVVRKPSKVRSAPAKLRYKPAKQEPVTTGLAQMTYAMSKVALGKPMSRKTMTDKLTRAALETVIYRWNGVKNFLDNGRYWMQNRVEVAGFRSLPFYMFDLTACNNMCNGLATQCAPFLQLGANTANGNMSFRTVSGLDPSGTVATSSFVIERGPSPPGLVATTSVNLAPMTKSMLSWASIQMNLWGCTTKATKFAVQLVRITDRDLIPYHPDGFYAAAPQTFAQEIIASGASADDKKREKRNDFYQNLTKTWVYNPISTTGGIQHKSYKVLKTQEFTIEPNLTIDGDSNANVKVFKMFATLNKMCNYEDFNESLNTDAQLVTDPSYVQNTGSQLSTQVKPTSRVYLVIRATNYGNDAGDTPAETPSFDLSVRVKHTISQ